MLERVRGLPRRTLVAACAALACALALVVTLVIVQVRAADAAERREAAAAAALADEREREAAEAEARERAEREAAAAAADAWAASAERAGIELAAADVVLAASAGQVADDAVRAGLAAAIETVRAMLAASRSDASLADTAQADTVGAPVAADLDGAVAAMTAAAAAVTQAQQEWVAAQEAAAAAEAARAAEEEATREAPRATAPPRTLGGPPSTGAGPDCGSPASYEPPKNDGPTFYTSTPSAAGDGTNGRIPASQLSPLGWCQDSQGNKQWLRHDAAAALTALNEAFRAQFGENIAVDMSYRSYEDQVAMREAYGSIAARPGTSNHGTGRAIDTWEWQAYAFGSPRYEWLVANGPAYGWVAPDWARQHGSNPEYWHFEYVG